MSSSKYLEALSTSCYLTGLLDATVKIHMKRKDTEVRILMQLLGIGSNVVVGWRSTRDMLNLTPLTSRSCWRYFTTRRCCTVWSRFLVGELCEKVADTRRHVSNQATTLEAGCQGSVWAHGGRYWHGWHLRLDIWRSTSRWKRTFEGLREGHTFHLFHLVCISLGTTGFALGFLFLEFGLWCLFGFLLCFLVRCLGILISFSFSSRCWPTMSRTRPAMQEKKKSKLSVKIP